MIRYRVTGRLSRKEYTVVDRGTGPLSTVEREKDKYHYNN